MFGFSCWFCPNVVAIWWRLLCWMIFKRTKVIFDILQHSFWIVMLQKSLVVIAYIALDIIHHFAMVDNLGHYRFSPPFFFVAPSLSLSLFFSVSLDCSRHFVWKWCDVAKAHGIASERERENEPLNCEANGFYFSRLQHKWYTHNACHKPDTVRTRRLKEQPTYKRFVRNK